MNKDLIDIAPGIFGLEDGSVINVKGENYVKQDESPLRLAWTQLRATIHNRIVKWRNG